MKTPDELAQLLVKGLTSTPQKGICSAFESLMFSLTGISVTLFLHFEPFIRLNGSSQVVHFRSKTPQGALHYSFHPTVAPLDQDVHLHILLQLFWDTYYFLETETGADVPNTPEQAFIFAQKFCMYHNEELRYSEWATRCYSLTAPPPRYKCSFFFAP